MIALAIEDQRGLIDINHAGPGLLRALFRANGAEPETADPLVDRIVEWRSPPGTQHFAGASDTDAAELDYRPRHGPFQSLDELQLVKGMTPEIYKQVAAALTIYPHTGDFDMRVAPRAVLRVIPGMNPSRAELALAGRVPVFAKPSATFSIVAKARKDDISFTRRAMVEVTGDPAQPYRVLDWQ
jgi:general secretion pathway protein K